MSVAAFTLKPVAPYRLDLTTWLLRRRDHNAMDCWTGGVYRRALIVDGTPAQIFVAQQGEQVFVRVESAGRAGVRNSGAASLLDRILGLSADLTAFYAFADRDLRL